MIPKTLLQNLSNARISRHRLPKFPPSFVLAPFKPARPEPTTSGEKQ